MAAMRVVIFRLCAIFSGLRLCIDLLSLHIAIAEFLGLFVGVVLFIIFSLHIAIAEFFGLFFGVVLFIIFSLHIAILEFLGDNKVST